MHSVKFGKTEIRNKIARVKILHFTSNVVESTSELQIQGA